MNLQQSKITHFLTSISPLPNNYSHILAEESLPSPTNKSFLSEEESSLIADKMRRQMLFRKIGKMFTK